MPHLGSNHILIKKLAHISFGKRANNEIISISIVVVPRNASCKTLHPSKLN